MEEERREGGKGGNMGGHVGEEVRKEDRNLKEVNTLNVSSLNLKLHCKQHTKIGTAYNFSVSN